MSWTPDEIVSRLWVGLSRRLQFGREPGPQRSTGGTSTADRARRIAVAAVGVGTTLAITACTAGTAGTAAGGSNGAPDAGGANKFMTFSPCCSWGTTWSYNRYNVNGLGIADNYIQLPLAIQKAPSLTEYAPQLAQS